MQKKEKNLPKKKEVIKQKMIKKKVIEVQKKKKNENI